MSRAVPRAIFFDFGGTLFSYADVWGRNFYPILLEATRRLGVESEAGQAGPAFRAPLSEPDPLVLTHLHQTLTLHTPDHSRYRRNRSSQTLSDRDLFQGFGKLGRGGIG